MTMLLTRPLALLGLSGAVLVLSACGTEEVGPSPVTHVGIVAGPDNAEVWWVFPPPAATYEEAQARAASAYGAQYFAFLDGKQLAFDQDGKVYPASISEGSSGSIGFLPSGRHRFAVVTPGGQTVFAGDSEIVPGSITHMYLYGRLGALQGRFVSYPAEPAPDLLHVSVINLVPDGRSIEMVNCANADDCASLSPALAQGEDFGADFPAMAGQPYTLADGRWIGWRQVPTAAAPAPPVQQITWEVGRFTTPTSGTTFSPNFLIAPLYLSTSGDPLSVF